FAHAAHVRVDGIEHVFVVREFRFALGGDRVELLAAVFSAQRRETHVFEHGQQWINNARRGRVCAARALFDFLNQLVTVPRRFPDQRQDEETQVALLEHAPAAAIAVMAPTMPAAPEMLAPAGPALAMSMKMHTILR